MSLKAKANETYDARAVTEALARLAKRFDLKSLPFSADELRTLAERSRESHGTFESEKQKERLGSYMAHLSTLYGEHGVWRISAALEQINNDIGYEEK